jgi:hypothetical protein
MIYTSINDFRDKKGHVDWSAYRKRKKETGEECTSCENPITFPKGVPALCRDCQELSGNEGEIDHEKIIRCPACKNNIPVEDFMCCDFAELFEGGEHKIDCPDCEFEFTVGTDVYYRFTSPALLSDDEN